MYCFICDKKGDMTSNICQCKMFYSHKKCFDDFYAFHFCPVCFGPIINNKLRLNLGFTNYFMLSNDLEKYKNILKKINAGLSGASGLCPEKYEVLDKVPDNQSKTITLCVSTTGDFCLESVKFEINKIKGQIRDKLENINKILYTKKTVQ